MMSKKVDDVKPVAAEESSEGSSLDVAARATKQACPLTHVRYNTVVVAKGGKLAALLNPSNTKHSSLVTKTTPLVVHLFGSNERIGLAKGDVNTSEAAALALLDKGGKASVDARKWVTKAMGTLPAPTIKADKKRARTAADVKKAKAATTAKAPAKSTKKAPASKKAPAKPTRAVKAVKGSGKKETAAAAKLRLTKSKASAAAELARRALTEEGRDSSDDSDSDSASESGSFSDEESSASSEEESASAGAGEDGDSVSEEPARRAAAVDEEMMLAPKKRRLAAAASVAGTAAAAASNSPSSTPPIPTQPGEAPAVPAAAAANPWGATLPTDLGPVESEPPAVPRQRQRLANPYVSAVRKPSLTSALVTGKVRASNPASSSSTSNPSSSSNSSSSSSASSGAKSLDPEKHARVTSLQQKATQSLHQVLDAMTSMRGAPTDMDFAQWEAMESQARTYLRPLSLALAELTASAGSDVSLLRANFAQQKALQTLEERIASQKSYLTAKKEAAFRAAQSMGGPPPPMSSLGGMGGPPPSAMGGAPVGGPPSSYAPSNPYAPPPSSAAAPAPRYHDAGW
jgi:hypothetical protein